VPLLPRQFRGTYKRRAWKKTWPSTPEDGHDEFEEGKDDLQMMNTQRKK